MNANEVTQRFVQSYYNLYASRIVQTKKQFCDACGTYSNNFNLMQKGLRPCSNAIQLTHNGVRPCTLEMVCTLITAYNINPRWLFTGVGGFFVEYT